MSCKAFSWKFEGRASCVCGKLIIGTPTTEFSNAITVSDSVRVSDPYKRVVITINRSRGIFDLMLIS